MEAARNGPCLENFYPRPPRGGRPFRFALLYDDITISIHALREEGDARDLAGDNTNTISIHALREEGDDYRLQDNDYSKKLISIHALREEGDVYRCPSGR